LNTAGINITAVLWLLHVLETLSEATDT